MNSVWQEVSLPHYEQLTKDISTEVLIIGGGMAGLLCAYLLKKAGISNTLVEADSLCSGITKNTTAKITSQHGLIYSKLIKQQGLQKAKQYLSANEEALQKYRELCSDIDCDFEEKDNFVYSINNHTCLKKELHALEQLSFPADLITELPVPFPTAGAVRFQHQAQFHPIKFIKGILPGLKIYEHTKVSDINGTIAVTEKAKISAKKIIVTTHFPFWNQHGSFFLKLYQQRSYVLALENAQNVNGMYVDEAGKGVSLRNYGKLLLLGSESHRTGTSCNGYQELQRFATRHYKNAAEKYHWATQDCISLDRIPYIGQYSRHTEDVYVATGFNKWGMTSSMVSALLLCDLVEGIRNPYEALFSPSRSILHPQLLANGFEAAAHLLVPTTRRCTHLGCALKWNPAEHTYDCPCHGSRFSKEGEVIDNPAKKNLKKKHC